MKVSQPDWSKVVRLARPFGGKVVIHYLVPVGDPDDPAHRKPIFEANRYDRDQGAYPLPSEQGAHDRR